MGTTIDDPQRSPEPVPHGEQWARRGSLAVSKNETRELASPPRSATWRHVKGVPTSANRRPSIGFPEQAKPATIGKVRRTRATARPRGDRASSASQSARARPSQGCCLSPTRAPLAGPRQEVAAEPRTTTARRPTRASMFPVRASASHGLRSDATCPVGTKHVARHQGHSAARVALTEVPCG